jgi:uncharacterized damage-inducible protein DinB
MHQLLVDHLTAVGFDEDQALRDQLLDILSDEDLSTSFGGATLTLGQLCRSFGEIEYAYVRSFETFQMDYAYHHEDPRVEHSVGALRAWYAALDRDLIAALEALSEDDLTNRRIVRSDFDPSYYSPRPISQLGTYREALLIFYGKAGIYLPALQRPFPAQWQTWIG